MKESTSFFDRRALHARRISALTSPFSKQYNKATKAPWNKYYESKYYECVYVNYI